MRIPKSCGHVYVIEARGRVKIGRSVTPTLRVKRIGTQGGAAADRTYITPLHEGFMDTELGAHRHFSQHRAIGEWFDISFEDAVCAVKSLFMDHGELTEDRQRELIAAEDERWESQSKGLLSCVRTSFASNEKAYEGTPESRAEAFANGAQLAIDAYMSAMEKGSPVDAAVSAMEQLVHCLDADDHDGLLCLYSFVGQLLELSMDRN